MDVLKEFPEEARREAVEVANYVTSQVRFVPWTPADMSVAWRKRSLQQIRNSEEVNACVPCIETAALAAAHLAENGIPSSVTLFTEEGAARDFVGGQKKKLHLDAVASIQVNHFLIPYSIDIGAGDVTLLKSGLKSSNDVTLLTTRPDEPTWRRTIISQVSGKDLLQERETPILELLLDGLVTRLPFGLVRGDFYGYNPKADDGDEFYNHGAEFNYTHERSWNQGWTEGVQHVFPGLKPFRYGH